MVRRLLRRALAYLLDRLMGGRSHGCRVCGWEKQDVICRRCHDRQIRDLRAQLVASLEANDALVAMDYDRSGKPREEVRH